MGLSRVVSWRHFIRTSAGQFKYGGVLSSFTKNDRVVNSPQNRQLHTTTKCFQNSAKLCGKNGNNIEVSVDGKSMNLYELWLRDHCRCDECYSKTTLQKNILAKDISPDTNAKQFDLKEGVLNIKWDDGHESQYNLDWLKENYYPGPSKPKVEKLLWNSQIIEKEDFPIVKYDTYVNKGEGLKKLLETILKYGYGIVEGMEASVDGTGKVMEEVSHINDTLFGGVWSFTSDLARSDTAYTKIALGAHTDTTYFQLPMGIQCFHVLQHDGEGGETLLVDGFHALEELRRTDQESFDILSKHRVHHEYREAGPPPHHVVSLAPIIECHPVTQELECLRYNHYDRAPINTVPDEELPGYYKALRAISKELEDKSREQWVKLRPGQVLFVDNWRVLHGRAAFTGYRRVCGGYLPRDDWVGKARTLGLV